MIIFAVATSRPGNYEKIYGRVSYFFNDDYLIVQINTAENPENYILERDSFYVYFEDRNEYQIFINEINDTGENISRYVIVDYPNESEIIPYGGFVFETSVLDEFFVIKVKKELIRFENVYLKYIILINKNGGSESHYR